MNFFRGLFLSFRSARAALVNHRERRPCTSTTSEEADGFGNEPGCRGCRDRTAVLDRNGGQLMGDGTLLAVAAVLSEDIVLVVLCREEGKDGIPSRTSPSSS